MPKYVNLEKGTQFNKMGRWYVEIDEIMEINNHVALVKCHEDDGFIQYYIFEKDECGWFASESSTVEDAARDEFIMISKYRYNVN